ncbi:type II secretion system protein GspK [Synergistes jonesii]|uniref:type II secretion system protein GspK n=1 Tax=Synergistes jonesii TaxID=2754 RepID=UPI00248E91F1|nr:type II secretion system protein GspK [Synergistes jonesii]
MPLRSRGFILISVLFATTLLLTSATAFAWFARTEAKRAAARENILKCRGAAEIAAGIAGKKIAEDANGYDGFDEPLYAPGQDVRIEIGNYAVTVHMTPLNGKMPLNAILLPDGVTPRAEYRAAWNAIWEEAGHAELAQRVIDFIDVDDRQKLGGAESEKNINRPLSDLCELKALPEIDDAILWGDEEHPGGVARYLDVLGGQKINVNVAEPEMIAKLDPEISLETARGVASSRLSRPIKSLDDLRRVPGFPPALATKLANVIGYESTDFLLEMRVEPKGGAPRNYRIRVRRSKGSCMIEEWEG